MAQERYFGSYSIDLLVVLTVILMPARTLAAQDPCVAPVGGRVSFAIVDTIPPPCPDPLYPPYSRPWPNSVAHAADLSLNAGLGALTAGLRAKLEGRPFWPAFKNGALGGAITYAGKRIIGTGKPGLRLIGRQVAALGGSAVRNAGDGRAPFAAAILPLGPARFYVGEPGLRVKLDLAGSVALLYVATRPHAHFEMGASLAAGTPIFTNVAVGSGLHQGTHTAGVIGLIGNQSNRAIAHELVHTAQYDFTFIAWANPSKERWFHLSRGVSSFPATSTWGPTWRYGDWAIGLFRSISSHGNARPC